MNNHNNDFWLYGLILRGLSIFASILVFILIALFFIALVKESMFLLENPEVIGEFFGKIISAFNEAKEGS